MKSAILFVPALLFSATIYAPAAEIKDRSTAITKAQHICRLETPNRAGQWQAQFVKNAKFGDEWHVWFGKDRAEPVCGFDGAVMKADGSYTSCRISACSPTPRQR